MQPLPNPTGFSTPFSNAENVTGLFYEDGLILTDLVDQRSPVYNEDEIVITSDTIVQLPPENHVILPKEETKNDDGGYNFLVGKVPKNLQTKKPVPPKEANKAQRPRTARPAKPTQLQIHKLGTIRGRGKRPKGDLFTKDYTNGNYVKRRKAFRTLRDLVVANFDVKKTPKKQQQTPFNFNAVQYSPQRKADDEDEILKAIVTEMNFTFIDTTFLKEILEQANGATPLSTLSKIQRKKLVDAEIYVKPVPKKGNTLQRLCYLYSKGAEETFFKDPRSNELFLHFFEQIRDT